MARPPDYRIIYNWDGAPHGFSEVPQSMDAFLDEVYGSGIHYVLLRLQYQACPGFLAVAGALLSYSSIIRLGVARQDPDQLQAVLSSK